MHLKQQQQKKNIKKKSTFDSSQFTYTEFIMESPK